MLGSNVIMLFAKLSYKGQECLKGLWEKVMMLEGW